MAISRNEAQELCTSPEYEFVLSSFTPKIREYSLARLKQKVERSRRLRDKYRDLAQRQHLEGRGKRPPARRRPARGNLRTQRKATLFRETLERFEKRVATLTQQPIKPVKTTRMSNKAPNPKTRVQKNASKPSKVATRAKTPNPDNQVLDIKIKSHLRAAGKRNQTRRDRQ